jgi:hypothetical protein
MLKILHRVNELAGLRKALPEYGVEMDLHAFGDRLVVHHEAFTNSLAFEDWLDAYHHRFAILNVKEEGIETRVRNLAVQRGIDNFFMLDLSFPALMKMVRSGESRLAIRVSEFEPVAGALALAGKIDWAWIDVFNGLPLDAAEYASLRGAGYRLCLVSPELHGRELREIGEMRRELETAGMTMDAVCTKRPDLW